MLVRLRISGGLGVSYEGSVEVSRLPGELASQVRTILTKERLSRISRRRRPSDAVDTISYEIGIEDVEESFRIDETQADAATLDLLDELRPHLRLHRRR